MNDRHKRLVETAFVLYEREKALKKAPDTETVCISKYKIEDYSFIIFPMAKAYEGFLKRSFLDLGIMDLKTFEGKRFRIGRALNPDVHQNQRDRYWLYDDMKRICGPETTRELWNTWLECRNRVFHFFATVDNGFSLEVVEKKLLKISNAMQSLVECQMSLGQNKAKEYDVKQRSK